jgi:hypothetical protein
MPEAPDRGHQGRGTKGQQEGVMDGRPRSTHLGENPFVRSFGRHYALHRAGVVHPDSKRMGSRTAVEERWGPNYLAAGRDCQDGQPSESTTESRKQLEPMFGDAPVRWSAPCLKILPRAVGIGEPDARACCSLPSRSTSGGVSFL